MPATAFPVGMAGGLPLSLQVMSFTDAVGLGVARLLAKPLGAPAAFR